MTAEQNGMVGSLSNIELANGTDVQHGISGTESNV